MSKTLTAQDKGCRTGFDRKAAKRVQRVTDRHFGMPTPAYSKVR